MKKIFLLFCALALSIQLLGCQQVGGESGSSVPEPVSYPVEVGQSVFEQAPQTVASLSPALTEIICELGYQSKITARSRYCDYPAEITAVADIGSSANPDIELLIQTAPELVISQSPIAKKDITKIENAGIRVLILPAPDSLDALRACYLDIAELFGGAITAEEAAASALAPLEDAVKSAETRGSFAYIVTNDLAVATGDTLAGSVLSLFGENIAKDNQKYSVTAEELLQKQPDILFFAKPLTAENLPAEAAGLNAVAGGKMISIDNTSFERPTARLLSGLIGGISGVLDTLAAQEVSNTETAAETAAQ